MPIYEYKCENGHVFDVIQKMADEPLTECQECGAPAVRVLHSPAVHFKGSGFYNTDYGKRRRAAASTAPRRRLLNGVEGLLRARSSGSSGLEVERVEVERLRKPRRAPPTRATETQPVRSAASGG